MADPEGGDGQTHYHLLHSWRLNHVPPCRHKDLRWKKIFHHTGSSSGQSYQLQPSLMPNNPTPALATVTRQQKKTEAAPPPTTSPQPDKPVTANDRGVDDSDSASPEEDDQQTELSNLMILFIPLQVPTNFI